MPINQFIQTLPSGPLDIVGDVHGEWAVLQQLLTHLGYDERGEHPQGRRLVFIGDVCDRGPDSPAALAWVNRAREQHGVLSLLGNHEVNILAGDPKDGSAWFFDSRIPEDEQYQPYQRLAVEHRAALLEQLQTWPVILERDDLRLVHAAWLPESVAQLKALSSEKNVSQWYHYFDNHVHELVNQDVWYPQYLQEYDAYEAVLGQEQLNPPLLKGYTEFDLSRWRQNPVRALLSGSEEAVETPFYSGARWRFTGRSAWWNNYHDDVPVIMGHYWRLWQNKIEATHRHAGLMPADGREWFGAQKNVYCIDFSVGARWRDRRSDIAESQSKYHLAALRWPEQTVMLENGQTFATTSFQTL
ncbi:MULTISPECIES: metallophosphoesterase [Vitreoscilla]|uniref:Metallophosphoesterase n=1 Tax=Vitreoscilla stercoraria TaxID=61 RepID=A0ABY4EC57_VITST|nr:MULTISPECIES: metallophosphoesterase [Vitreoscilla]AUZ05578.2 hypothetical protein ADP71_21610 [Vitreoscilla sp. C1]UOO93005.1 metallophosphoesterase [Vitreoscilla stercoraria]